MEEMGHWGVPLKVMPFPWASTLPLLPAALAEGALPHSCGHDALSKLAEPGCRRPSETVDHKRPFLLHGVLSGMFVNAVQEQLVETFNEHALRAGG